MAQPPSGDPEALLARKRAQRPLPRKKRWPDLEVDQVLAWADAHHARTGQWPIQDSGPIAESPRDKWRNIDNALRLGLRGFQPGSSLARLLAERRGVRNRSALPGLTEAQILAWADSYRAGHGRWPQAKSGPVETAPGETWNGVETALQVGLRGLPGGSSLAKLLAEHRGLRNSQCLPPLTVAQILAWADRFYQRCGRWPKINSGPVAEAPGETWNGVNVSLQLGCRGLPGGSTLARLLAAERGARHRTELPDLSVEQILAWADAHRERTNQWPKSTSGPIADAPGETWCAVHVALQKGGRGLTGGSSLPQLLAQQRGVWHPKNLAPLAVPRILGWADAYRARHGDWPHVKSGPIEDAPGENWAAVNAALEHGSRGLPDGSSLARLLAQHRGVAIRRLRPPLTREQILAWAKAHRARTGHWPQRHSGPIPDAPDETWSAVNTSLEQGYRGLAAGSSLAKLLEASRQPELNPLTSQKGDRT
jgi:hypothetical protein